jgi:hypothetical protein
MGSSKAKWTQRDLAERLGIPETQARRDPLTSITTNRSGLSWSLTVARYEDRLDVVGEIFWGDLDNVTVTPDICRNAGRLMPPKCGGYTFGHSLIEDPTVGEDRFAVYKDWVMYGFTHTGSRAD